MNREIQKEALAYKVEIFICGTGAEVSKVCQDYCDKVGLCVTLTETRYIYRGGWQYGFIVGLINYARFPKSRSEIWQQAVDLAYKIKEGAAQGSFTVQDGERSVFLSTRDEDQ